MGRMDGIWGFFGMDKGDLGDGGRILTQRRRGAEIPACAGMTVMGREFGGNFLTPMDRMERIGGFGMDTGDLGDGVRDGGEKQAA